MKFSSSNHSHKKIIELLENIIQVQKQDDLKELKTKQALIELWGQIYRNIDFIALETGFESDAYFCRCFKKHFGMTPGMYRKINLVK